MTSQPNLYDLYRKGVHVQYATTGIDGKARLSYRDTKRARSFVGDEITVEDTAAGRLVTVILEAVPDLHTISFSFFLPMINLEREAHVETTAIYATGRTSIGGPALVRGQIGTWSAVTLSGMARAVEF